MAGERRYSSNAERQKAYRLRRAGPRPVASNARPARRAPSRPARLAAALGVVEALRDEYEQWLNSLPESLTASGQAERLAEVIEQLGWAAETLSSVDPPRGFGRD